MFICHFLCDDYFTVTFNIHSSSVCHIQSPSLICRTTTEHKLQPSFPLPTYLVDSTYQPSESPFPNCCFVPDPNSCRHYLTPGLLCPLLSGQQIGWIETHTPSKCFWDPIPHKPQLLAHPSSVAGYLLWSVFLLLPHNPITGNQVPHSHHTLWKSEEETETKKQNTDPAKTNPKIST